ncbi:MAG: hypothetical protein ACI9WU_005428 [Myxococcota bacterium]
MPPQDSSTDAGQAPVEGCTTAQPGIATARLVTRLEYDLTVGDLLLTDTRIARDTFPPENHALGFENNADAHTPSPLLVERQIDAARILALEAVTDRLEQLAPCATQGTDLAACRDQFTADFGRRAFRRPLHPHEHDLLKGVFDAGAAGGDAANGVAFVIRTALLSPQFLYRTTEMLADEADGQVIALSGYELASRLSYFLWSAAPDDALLSAAEAGQLDSPDGLEAEARRLLAHPRAVDSIDSFHRQWLELDRLDHLEKTLPPELLDAGITIETLRQSWRASIEAFVHHAVLPPGTGLPALLGDSAIFVDPTLSLLHPGAQDVDASGLWSADPSQRAGLLTQPALLAVLAHSEQSSPIRRGLFVRDRLLCQPMPSPPPDVVITPPDPDPNATTRERFAQHTADPECAGCHNMIDPVGFGFEHYDQLGRWRDTENGLPIDATGDLINVPWDKAVEGPFDGAVELAGALSASPRVAACVAEHWYRFAMGRGTSAPEDGCNLDRIEQALISADGDIIELLVAIVRSDAFRLRPGTDPVVIEPTTNDSDPELIIPEAEPVVEVPPLELPPGDPDPKSPIGFWDSLQDNGIATGWALDPNQPLYELFIIIRVDGQTVEPYQRADKPRPDVNEVTGYPGDHGFTFQLPAAAMDGNPHSIELIAVDVGDSPNFQANGSPKTFQTSSGLPKGFIDSVSGTGPANAGGWAFDPDSPTTPITVRLYLDAPSWQGGTLLGQTTTSGARPDVVAAFNLDPAATPGWNFELPESALDGQPHVVFAEAADSADGTAGFLSPLGGKAWTGGTP